MPTFDSIRKQAPWMQDWSDEEVMLKLSELTNTPLADVAKDFGVKLGTERSVVGAGLTSGWEGLKGLGYSGGAAVSDVLGAGGAKDWFERQALAKEVQASIASRPELEKIEEQTLGSALPYVGYQVAKQVPNIVGAIAAGALVPEAAVPAALSRGAAMLPRALGGGGLGGRVAAAGAEAGAQFAAKRAALETGETFGKQVVGGLAFNEAQSVGSLYQAAREGGDENAGAKALLGSPLYALSETLPEAMLVGRFKGGSGFTGNILTRMGKSAGVQGVSGATSEGLQNEMEMALNPTLTEDQKFSNRLNSIAAGGLVEGILGGLGGMSKGGRLPSRGSLVAGANTTEQPDVSQTPDDRGINTAIDSSSGGPSVIQNAEVGQAKLAQFVPTAQAQAAQQVADAQVEAQQVAQQQAQLQATQQQAQRQAALDAFGVKYTSPNQSTAMFMGQPIAGTGRIAALADELNKVVSAMPEHKVLLARALMSADETTAAKRLGFKFDGANVQKSVQNAVNALGKLQQKYMIDEAADMEEVANILNTQSQTAKGKDLEFINAVYEAITGKNTIGYEQSQGATNGTLQTTAGVGTVSEQGGASQTTGGELGLLRPQQVQPVQSGSQPVGSLAVQDDTGRETGARTGAGIAPAAGVSGNVGAPSPQPLTGVQRGQQTTDTNLARANEGAATATQLGEQVLPQGGRGDSAPNGDAAAQETDASRVVQDILELVITRKGSMKAADVPKYRDFIRLYMGGVNDEMLPIIANQYLGITIDQAKKWNKKAKTFLEDNAEALQKAVAEIADKYGMQPQDVFALAPSEDAVATEKPLIEEVGGAKSVVDERDLASMDEEGNTTDADVKGSKTKGVSVQEQFNDAETINAKYLRIAEALAKAEAKGDTEKAAKLEAELMQVVEDAERVGKRKERQIRANAGEGEAKTETTAAKKETPKAADKTEQMWDKQANEFGLPTFAELSPGAQADWIASVKKGKTGLAAMNAVYEANQKSFKLNDDTDTQDDEGVETSLDDLKQNYESVQTVSDEYDFLGIGHVLNLVTRWGISQKGSDGSYNGMKGGRQRVTYRADRIAGNGGLAFITVSHEVGHAVDRAAFGGVYSSQPEFGVAVMDGELIPTGAVMREMYNLFKSDPDGWGEYLGYPFDHDAYPKLSENPGRIRAELFSQLWAAYTKPNLRRMLSQDAPVTHKFMEKVVEHVRANTKIQPSTTKVAERTALDFATRNAQGGIEDSGQVGEQYDSIQARRKEVASKAKSYIDNLPTWARGPVRSINNVLFGGKATTLGIMITEDVAQLAEKYMPSVKRFIEVQHLRNSLTAEKERRLTTIKTKFEELSSNDKRAVNKLIGDMTVDGKWAFDPGYLKTPPTIDNDLKQRFNALPATAQFVVKEVFKVGHDNLIDKQQTIRKKIDEAFDKREAEADTEAQKQQLAREKAQMEKQFAGVLNINPSTPYAPLKRFGSFVVVAKSQAYKDAEAMKDTKALKKMESDENHYIVEFAETAGEAEEIYDTLRKAGGYEVEAPFKKSTIRDSLYRGTDLYKGFAKLKRLINAEQGVDAGNEVLKELEGMVNQLYLLSLAESSARKSEMQRKKISGYNRDMMRAFFTQGMADSHYIANLKTADESMDAIVEMQKEAGKNRTEAYPYLNELMAREAQSLEVREPSLGDAMNRMAGDWFLTFSPAFYFQQLTQTYVLSLPWLAGKYNYFKSERALRAAYKDILPMIKETGLKEHMDFSKAPDDVREMLKTLVGRGRIDIGVEAELGGFRSEGTNKLADAYNNTTNRLRGAINRIEALNRSVAAVAAYRLEMQKSGDKTKAIDAADKVVHVTHGSYDGFNTPRLFNMNAVTRSVTQFRRFQVIQLTMLGRMLKAAFQGATPTEKAMGRKQLMFLLAHSGVLGGVKGMPIYVPAALLYAIAKGAFGDDDDPEDFEAWLREQGGLLLARGVPAELGVDLSGKLGMGNVLSLLPYTDIDLTSKKGMGELALGAMGPFVGGLLPKMADGVNLLAGGDYYRGLEQLLPNGLSNGIKAIRFTDQGITQRNGDVVMSPEEIGFMDNALQAVGLPTTTMTERQYRQGQTIKYDQFYNERSKELKNQYARATRDNDAAEMADLRDKWMSLQQSRVKNGYDRKPLSELLKAPREQMKRERGVVGGVETKKANRGFVRGLTEE
jgi:hypothetical protein